MVESEKVIKPSGINAVITLSLLWNLDHETICASQCTNCFLFLVKLYQNNFGHSIC